MINRAHKYEKEETRKYIVYSLDNTRTVPKCPYFKLWQRLLIHNHIHATWSSQAPLQFYETCNWGQRWQPQITNYSFFIQALSLSILPMNLEEKENGV